VDPTLRPHEKCTDLFLIIHSRTKTACGLETIHAAVTEQEFFAQAADILKSRHHKQETIVAFGRLLSSIAMKVAFVVPALCFHAAKANVWVVPSAPVTNFQAEKIASVDGLFEVKLSVDLLGSFEGSRVAKAYNNATVGPTLRVKPGDKVSVTLEN